MRNPWFKLQLKLRFKRHLERRPPQPSWGVNLALGSVVLAMASCGQHAAPVSYVVSDEAPAEGRDVLQRALDELAHGSSTSAGSAAPTGGTPSPASSASSSVRSPSGAGMSADSDGPPAFLAPRQHRFRVYPDGTLALTTEEDNASLASTSSLASKGIPSFPIQMHFASKGREGIRLTVPKAPDLWLRVAPRETATGAHRAVADGYVVYPNLWRGVDAIYAPRPDGAEEYLHIHQKLAAGSLAFDVDLGAGIAGLRQDGSGHGLEAFDHQGRTVFRAPMPEGRDHLGRYVQGHLGARQTDDGTWRIELTVSTLDAAYPVLLDPTWTSTGSLATGRAGHTAMILSPEKVLVVGGSGPLGPLASAEVYNITTKTFSATGSMAEARSDHAMVPLKDTTVLVVGGASGSGISASAERYNPTTGTFTTTGSMAFPRAKHTATVLSTGTHVVVAGGHGPTGQPRDSLEKYDSTTGTFTTLPNPMTQPRASHSATALDSGLILFAEGQGASGMVNDNAELFNPATNTSTATGATVLKRYRQMEVKVGPGKVILAGGTNGAEALPDIEVFNEAGGGTFTRISGLRAARVGGVAFPVQVKTGPTTTELRPVFVGGADRNNQELACSEAYDPSFTDPNSPLPGGSSFMAAMAVTRRNHTATPLPTGDVLVVGGQNVLGDAYYTSAELLVAGAQAGPNDPPPPDCSYTAALQCNSNGTVDGDSGACTCNSGYKGGRCQYSDAVTCHNNGVVQANGSCACQGAYADAYCTVCLPGYAGDKCQYSDGYNCNSHGKVKVNSNGSVACTCDPGFAGSKCEYSDALTCYGNGTVDDAGKCTCKDHFTGSDCLQCAIGYVGGQCQYSNATTCGGHGSAQADGTCICSSGYFGANCASSDPRAPCNNHGTANGTGFCSCDLGYTGAACQYSRSLTCSGHGSPDPFGGCTCDPGYAGATCNACGPNYVGYPNCNSCGGDASCSGHGTCTAGVCTCNAGYGGDHCHLMSSTLCGAHGMMGNDNQCVCDPGFAGAACDFCAPGYAGNGCQYSDAVTCQGHGTALYDGTCSCLSFPTKYWGANCQYSDALTCKGNGQVTSNAGACECKPGFALPDCGSCQSGYFGYPACLYCDAATVCHGHGTCNTTSGACQCSTGYTGPYCQYSNSSTCGDRGKALYDGKCECSPSYGGDSCDQCAVGYFAYPAFPTCIPVSSGSDGGMVDPFPGGTTDGGSGTGGTGGTDGGSGTGGTGGTDGGSGTGGTGGTGGTDGGSGTGGTGGTDGGSGTGGTGGTDGGSGTGGTGGTDGGSGTGGTDGGSGTGGTGGTDGGSGTGGTGGTDGGSGTGGTGGTDGGSGTGGTGGTDGGSGTGGGNTGNDPGGNPIPDGGYADVTVPNFDPTSADPSAPNTTSGGDAQAPPPSSSATPVRTDPQGSVPTTSLNTSPVRRNSGCSTAPQGSPANFPSILVVGLGGLLAAIRRRGWRKDKPCEPPRRSRS